MRTSHLVTAAVALTLVLAGCSTTVDGTGTRAGGPPSVTDFPSPTTSGSSTSPTDSPSPTGSSTSSGGDASDLIAAMKDDMAAVDGGFAVDGDFEDTGDVSGLELRMQGDSGQSTITFGDDSCEVRAVDGEGWAKGTETFWADYADVDADVAADIADQWVELSGDIAFLLAFADQDEFVDTIVPTTDDYTLGDTTTRDGVDAQELDSDDATLVVAVDSPHLLLAIVDDTGEASFTFPDDDVSVDAPSPTVPFPG